MLGLYYSRLKMTLSLEREPIVSKGYSLPRVSA